MNRAAFRPVGADPADSACGHADTGDRSQMPPSGGAHGRIGTLPRALGAGTARNAGIELFRCVSMILIVLLHVLGRGGVLASASASRGSYAAAWFLETVGYCSVNCYAVISGYVGINAQFRFRRIALLWLEVVFWLAVPAAVCKLFFPAAVGIDWGETFLPVTHKTFWYFNAYVLLFPFIPILNGGLRQLSRKRHLAILAFLFVAAACLHCFSGYDLFVTGSGYSGAWLIILYVFGAYFGRYGVPRFAKRGRTLAAFFACAAAAWAIQMLAFDLASAGIVSRDSLVYKCLGEAVNYTSPFMVIMAVCLLCFFAQTHVKPDWLANLIRNMGKGTFGVYLFHVGPVLWENWMVGRFRNLGKMSPPKLTVCALLAAVALFLLWDALSLGRRYLFRLCRVERGINRLADFLEKAWEKRENIE